MADQLADEARLRALVTELTCGADYQLHTGPVWLMASPARCEVPEHGWKLHVAARPATLVDVAAAIVGLLVEHRVMFKLAKSPATLIGLNDGITAPATVGKAFTIYPPAEVVRPLGEQLARRLAGQAAPRILSDRRVSDDAPVYYRYGPFRPSWRADDAGRLVSHLLGPGGETFDALAGLGYRQPDWVTDPFRPDEPAARSPSPGEPTLDPNVLGGRYRLRGGVVQSARGNVYRAERLDDGGPVIIKQARAFVGEDEHQIDARIRLRNERRVLTALAGFERVPRFLDHFRHGEDEYLVITDCGERNLIEDVQHNGRYTGTGDRDPLSLARELASILVELHDRGVVSRDVAPKNIVLGEAGCSLIDFGISAYDGVQLPGATPGYASPSQCRNAEARPADDAYGLGMTLLFTASDLHPLAADDPGLAGERALQWLGVHGRLLPTGLATAIGELIGPDEAAALAALRRLADGRVSAPASTAPVRATVPAITDELLDEIVSGLRDRLVRQARELLADPLSSPAGHDSSYYAGAAGIGLELLHHLPSPGGSGEGDAELRSTLAELGSFAASAAARAQLPPGLYVGTTGVEVFLRTLPSIGIAAEPLAEQLLFPPRPVLPEGEDLFVGSAGIGLGHLLLARLGDHDRHLVEARRYADQVCAAGRITSPYDDTELAAETIADLSAGRAHGLAGALELLLAMLEAAPEYRQPAERMAGQLAAHATLLTRRAAEPAAVALSVSWCRGLAGIAHTLLTAADVLDAPELAVTAVRAATECRRWVPRLGLPGQCCGLAGIGGLFVRLAWQQPSLDSEAALYFDAAADEVATQLLLRSVSRSRVPEFTEQDTRQSPASWAFGTAGLLAFFRCVRDRRFEDLLLVPNVGQPAGGGVSRSRR